MSSTRDGQNPNRFDKCGRKHNYVLSIPIGWVLWWALFSEFNGIFGDILEFSLMDSTRFALEGSHTSQEILKRNHPEVKSYRDECELNKMLSHHWMLSITPTPQKRKPYFCIISINHTWRTSAKITQEIMIPFLPCKKLLEVIGFYNPIAMWTRETSVSAKDLDNLWTHIWI